MCVGRVAGGIMWRVVRAGSDGLQPALQTACRQRARRLPGRAARRPARGAHLRRLRFGYLAEMHALWGAGRQCAPQVEVHRLCRQRRGGEGVGVGVGAMLWVCRHPDTSLGMAEARPRHARPSARPLLSHQRYAGPRPAHPHSPSSHPDLLACEEGREGCHDLAHRVQHIKQRGQRQQRVVRPVAPLEPLAVVPHIHVGEGVNEAHQVRYHGVQPAVGEKVRHGCAGEEPGEAAAGRHLRRTGGRAGGAWRCLPRPAAPPTGACQPQPGPPSSSTHLPPTHSLSFSLSLPLSHTHTPPHRPHLYASISSRTKAVSEREAAQIQRSSTLVAADTSTLSGWKACPVSCSHRTAFWTMNLQRGRGPGAGVGMRVGE